MVRIFFLMSRIEKTKEDIDKLEHLTHDNHDSFKVPQFYHVWKILSALEGVPEYRVFTDKVQQMRPDEWVQLKPDEIRTELHKLHSNKVSLQSEDKNNNNTVLFSSERKKAP